MSEEQTVDCSGKCKMVETYKTINRALTKQNSEYKEALAIKEKENNDLRQLVLELRTEIAENKKHTGISDTIEVVAMATEAFASISQTVQKVGAKLAIVNNKFLQAAGGSFTESTNNSPLRTPVQTRTPANVHRIRPIIRTPNGLMQSVSISLPRIDHSLLFSAVERSANSTTISQNGHSSTSSNDTTPLDDQVSEEVSEPEDTIQQSVTESTVETRVPDPVRDVPTRSPRHTNESPFLGFDDSEINSRPNPEILPTNNDQDLTYYDQLSVIQEVTEVDYTINPTRHDTDDESSGGEEIHSHQTSKNSLRANKENTLRSHNMSISQASCSTPYTNHRSMRPSDMKIAKVVLQPLNMEEIELSQKTTRERNESEGSEQSMESAVTTRQKPSGRKRKDSEMSENTDNNTDDESTHHNTGRPKRRATPTSFKEPKLNTKMRRGNK